MDLYYILDSYPNLRWYEDPTSPQSKAKDGAAALNAAVDDASFVSSSNPPGRLSKEGQMTNYIIWVTIVGDWRSRSTFKRIHITNG